MPFTALIIDDDADHREHVQTVLSALGAQVATASARLEAFRELNEKQFDLVIWRTDLAEMDGRHNRPLLAGASAHSPFIGVAPSLDRDEVRSYIRAGFYAVLPRPVRAWRLRELVYALGLAERPTRSAPDSLAVLDALSSPLRLRLYGAIAGHGEVTVTVLANDFGVVRQKLDHHLEALRSAGLIAAERRGRETWYSVRCEPAQAAAHWMLDMADDPAAYGASLS